MKIKELHLRNIASIESADIDFDKDLIDYGENSPAGIFLISGDTGAGKSAILDAISMALYKKTPRVAGVQNVKQNDYVNSNGEKVSINSIEQYSRLGISPKDECYSEVVFEGNDGITYHARLTLGIMLGNTDRKTGQRPLKYRTPLWEVKKAGGDWTKCSKNDTTILDAVGVSFEQFGRIAMLAQGQFASFLTGNKSEREAILEQLTDTERFSTYGAAIKNIFDRARKARDDEETAYRLLKGNALTAEQVDAKRSKLALLEKTKSEIAAAVETLSRRRSHAEELNRLLTAISESSRHKLSVAKRLDSDECREMATRVKFWDETVNQRRSLIILRSRSADKAKAESELSRLKTVFTASTADLMARRNDLAALDKRIAETKRLIDSAEAYAPIYTDSTHIVASLRELFSVRAAIIPLTKQISDLETMTPGLKTRATQTDEQAEKARRATELRQEEIDTLTRRRQALHPAETEAQTTACRNRRESLLKLVEMLAQLDSKRNELAALAKEIETETTALAMMKQSLATADATWEKAKAYNEASRNLLVTMEMSVSDVLTGLRRKLADEHADTCPLCGHAISTLPGSDDFKPILAPLEKRRAETAQALAEAEAARETAMRRLNHASGQLEAKTGQHRALETGIVKAAQEAEAQARCLNLNPDLPLDLLIRSEIDTADKELARLARISSDAEEIQSQINKLITLKKADDAEAVKAAELKATAEKKLAENNNEIDRRKELKKEKTAKAESLTATLGQLLKPRYDNWDTEECAATIERDSRRYAAWVKQFDADSAERGRSATIIDSFQGICQSISAFCPDWTYADKPQPLAEENPATKLNNLYGRVAALSQTITEATGEISLHKKLLDEYYTSSGITEHQLADLDARPEQIADARKTLTALNAELKSRDDAIADGRRRAADIRAALGLSDGDPVPDIAAIDNELSALSARSDEITRALGAINQELDSNSANTRQLEAQAVRLSEATARFEKWDRMNSLFGGTRLRTLVQTYILQPLLNNANIYLSRITDRYTLTCSEDNEQLSILVLDRYNKNQIRSATVLSGGERFMISLALSLALSSLNRPDMNVNILFIDEGFGTLDEKSLDSVMSTLEKLRQLAGQRNRRVGIISHREELIDRIPSQIRVTKKGEGRSRVTVTNTL